MTVGERRSSKLVLFELRSNTNVQKPDSADKVLSSYVYGLAGRIYVRQTLLGFEVETGEGI
jgi:hypothetical protein